MVGKLCIQNYDLNHKLVSFALTKKHIVKVINHFRLWEGQWDTSSVLTCVHVEGAAVAHVTKVKNTQVKNSASPELSVHKLN